MEGEEPSWESGQLRRRGWSGTWQVSVAGVKAGKERAVKDKVRNATGAGPCGPHRRPSGL